MSVSFDEFGNVASTGSMTTNVPPSVSYSFNNPSVYTAQPVASNNQNFSFSDWFQTTFSKANIDTALRVNNVLEGKGNGSNNVSRPGAGDPPPYVGETNSTINRMVDALGKVFQKPAQPNQYGSAPTSGGSLSGNLPAGLVAVLGIAILFIIFRRG